MQRSIGKSRREGKTMALKAAAATRKARLLSKNGGLGLMHVRGLRTFLLPDLPYDYGALELSLVERSCGYITKNTIRRMSQTLARLSTSSIEPWPTANVLLLFNCRAQSNSMAEEGGGEPPEGSLCRAIDDHFGSLEALIQKINNEGASLQGSGWWLALDTEQRRLSVEATSNQYKNEKSEYLKNIWNVINWKYAAHVYEQVTT